jgi:U3 small nucleolar RNA-associated protein 13
MACHPNGDLLASGGDQGEILVWDVNLGSYIKFNHASRKVVSRVMFHPDPEKKLVSP